MCKGISAGDVESPCSISPGPTTFQKESSCGTKKLLPMGWVFRKRVQDGGTTFMLWLLSMTASA